MTIDDASLKELKRILDALIRVFLFTGYKYVKNNNIESLVYTYIYIYKLIKHNNTV